MPCPTMPRRPHPIALLAPLALLIVLSGCQLTGDESPEQIAARKEAEGKAVGGACRHAGRAIEDCFALNKRADKSAMFTGWREMNDYMRENKIESMQPQPAVAVEAVPEKHAENGKKADESAASASAPPKKPAKSKKHDS